MAAMFKGTRLRSKPILHFVQTSGLNFLFLFFKHPIPIIIINLFFHPFFTIQKNVFLFLKNAKYRRATYQTKRFNYSNG